MKKIIFSFFIVLVFISACNKKTKYGDFTIITETDKYEALGGAIKIDGHKLLYKGNKIDWSEIDVYLADPNIENFKLLNYNAKCLLVEVSRNYYLLMPDGENVKIKFIATAATSSGAFTTKPYTELLKDNLYFHQAGMLLNLQTYKKDTLDFVPSGRFLAANEDVSKIVYLNGVFDDDTNLKKTMEKAQAYQQTGVYSYDGLQNSSTITVLEWDIKTNQQYQYSYADTTLWNNLNSYYEANSYLALTNNFDSSAVFNLFKWAKDSVGLTHLIPKQILPGDIKFTNLKSDTINLSIF